MPLTSSNAKTCADAFCTAAGITDATAKAVWEKLVTQLYTSLLTDLTVTIAAASITVAGSPTTQTGPALPVPAVVA